MNPPVKTNDYQLRQMLKKLTGDPHVMDSTILQDIPTVLRHLVSLGRLNLPFDPDTTYVVYERMPVLGQFANPRNSNIGKIILLRPDEVGIFVDGFQSGASAVYCVRASAYFEDSEILCQWIRSMSLTEIYIKPLDRETRIMVAPMKAFVTLDSTQ